MCSMRSGKVRGSGDTNLIRAILFSSTSSNSTKAFVASTFDLVEKIWTQFKKMWRQAKSPETQICAFACAAHIPDKAEHRASRAGSLPAADLKRCSAVGQARFAAFLRASGFRRVGTLTSSVFPPTPITLATSLLHPTTITR